jgi:tetratricopeptide (TPR) repeat protein
MQTMRNFSAALGVRCQHCHVSNGPSFRDTDFPNDGKPEKVTARYMIEMLGRLNGELLPALEHRGDPPVTMTCKTCHRGTARPFLLSQELLMAAHDGGGSAAVARYRELRERYETSGAYDFGEEETAGVAEALAGEGRYDDAIALLQLNAEMHAESSNAQIALGQTYEEMGETESAAVAYVRALELAPNNRRVQMMLDNLRGTPPQN